MRSFDPARIQTPLKFHNLLRRIAAGWDGRESGIQKFLHPPRGLRALTIARVGAALPAFGRAPAQTFPGAAFRANRCYMRLESRLLLAPGTRLKSRVPEIRLIRGFTDFAPESDGKVKLRNRAQPVRGKDRSPPHITILHELTFGLQMRTSGVFNERKFVMPTRHLPSNASIDHLGHQAKDLLAAHAARDSQVAQRIREFHPRFHKATDAVIFDTKLKLSDAQLTIAREHGFPSWARLRKHIEKPSHADNLNVPHHERIEDAVFRRAVDLLDAGDAEGLRIYLSGHPGIVYQRVVFEEGNYFRNPALLEFAAENPIRRGKLPPSIVSVAKVILDAGARTDQSAMDETLGLVCSGRVPRECGVQAPLIALLCDYGADPDGAMPPALVHGEFDAVNELIRRGASITVSVAAATGRTEDARQALASSSDEDRHRALALAAQFGYTEIVRLLLDAGEDLNRYNPAGFHSHSTPLHQAAWAGHFEVVRLLVERGARLDMQDTLFQGTPAGWANHAGRTEIEEYLRQRETSGGTGGAALI